MEHDKRKDVLSKIDFFCSMAVLVSKRSKDPNTQVGAVIVSDTDRILSVGYNGFPNGISDDDFPWAREAESDVDTKYPYVIHAEMNAILNFRGDLKALSGATLYVTLFPCHECVKAIIQTGIRKIIYLNDKYNGSDDSIEAKRMLDSVGIEYEEYYLPFELKFNKK